MANNTLISQEDLLNSKILRNNVINEKNLEVLDKVKAVPYFPQDIFVGIKQAATYYEVSLDTIKKAIQRNREELEDDGLRVLSYEEMCAYKDILKSLGDTNENYIGEKARAFVYIPKKALLRLGMLIKRSKVAIQIRTYLLNIEKNATKEQKTQAIKEISNKPIEIDNLSLQYPLEEKRLAIKNLQLEVREIKLNNQRELAMVEKYTRKAILLGIPALEASILIQESLMSNKDVEAEILNRLKDYENLNLTISRGRVRSQLSIIAETLFQNDYEILYRMLSERLRPILGINMKAIRDKAKKKYGKYSKQVPSYLDLIADYKAWEIAEQVLEEIKTEKLAMKAALKSPPAPRKTSMVHSLPEVK